MHAPVHEAAPPVENQSTRNPRHARRRHDEAAFVAIAGVRNQFAMPGQQMADSALEKQTRLYTKATWAETATAIPTGDQDLDRKDGHREVLGEAVHNRHMKHLSGNPCVSPRANCFLICLIRQAVL